MKQIPNMITTIRIFSSILLFKAEPFSKLFFTLYILCGISDMIDGYIARKTKNESQFGAAYDSVADAVFIGVLLLRLLPILQWPIWILYWIGAIAMIRILSLLIGFIKYRALAFLHTYANKITGIALFCFPILYDTFGLIIAASLICGIASISAFEEFLINAKSKILARDIHSIKDL